MIQSLKNRQNHNMKYFIPILALVMMAWSCSSEESPEIKEALKVHGEMLDMSISLDSSVSAEITRLQVVILDSLLTSNETEAIRIENSIKNLLACQIALNEWRSMVVEVPGHHHHAPGEVCDHDHSQDAMLEGLPDSEILAMQNDLFDALREIKAKAAVQ